MVGGSCGCRVVHCARIVPWAFVAICLCGRLLVVVGMHIWGRLVVVVDVHVRERLGLLLGSCRLLCAHRGMRVCRRSCWWAVVGGRCGWSSPVVVVGIGGGRVRLWFVVCVDGGGKEKGGHFTHCDNGIMFELPREITCR